MCGGAFVCWFSRTQLTSLLLKQSMLLLRRSERVVVLEASLAFHDTR